MQKSRKFFVNILQVFLARIKPASTMPKPACMKNTKNAAIRTQTVSKPCFNSAAEIDSSCATATSAIPNKKPAIIAPRSHLYLIVPAVISFTNAFLTSGYYFFLLHNIAKHFIRAFARSIPIHYYMAQNPITDFIEITYGSFSEPTPSH